MIETDDLIIGYQLVCALDDDTCLHCLLEDGKIYKTNTFVSHDGCRCVLVPKTKTFRELGISIDEIPVGTRSSSIGQIPKDGGVYKLYLIEKAKLAQENQLTFENLSSFYDLINSQFPTQQGDLAKIRSIITINFQAVSTIDFPSLVSNIIWPSQEIEKILATAIENGHKTIADAKLIELEKYIESTSPTYSNQHIGGLYNKIGTLVKKWSPSESLYYFKKVYYFCKNATSGVDLLKLYRKLSKKNEEQQLLVELSKKFPESTAVKKEIEKHLTNAST